MPNIVEAAVGSGRTNTLVEAVKAAGLVETLSSAGPFTVFAPVDEAFAKVDPDALKGLLADKEALTKVLTYHVVAGKHMASEVAALTSLTTVEGETLKVTSDAGGVHVGGAKVIGADIVVDNGVIHLIDAVLMPA